MAELRYPTGPQAAGPAGCPPVADLIQFSLGHLSADEGRRIERHQAQCADCRGWITRAQRFRNDPLGSPEAGFAPSLAALPAAAPALASQSAFMPDNPTWQRQAFGELEKRLRQLDEEQ